MLEQAQVQALLDVLNSPPKNSKVKIDWLKTWKNGKTSFSSASSLIDEVKLTAIGIEKKVGYKLRIGSGELVGASFS